MQNKKHFQYQISNTQNFIFFAMPGGPEGWRIKGIEKPKSQSTTNEIVKIEDKTKKKLTLLSNSILGKKIPNIDNIKKDNKSSFNYSEKNISNQNKIIDTTDGNQDFYFKLQNGGIIINENNQVSGSWDSDSNVNTGIEY